MLVLTRRVDERIRIGDDITLVVVELGERSGGLFVRLGIDAPKDIPIAREEIYKGPEDVAEVD
jgi:carbon storage regulator